MKSIAIAGAWGYIGRKLLDAARRRGLGVYVCDPGPEPADLDPGAVTRLTDEEAFYRLPADVFHLALQPEARERAEALLLERARSEPIWILNEKPMFAPGGVRDGRGLIEAVDRSQGVMLYDFPELFDPLTRRVTEYLGSLGRVEIESIVVERSKDREDPAIPRNHKRMVSIQYQESVHCLAWVLSVLGTTRGSLDAALQDGVTVRAASQPYTPPNPELYAGVVDGRCEFRLRLGEVTVDGVTNFKRGAAWRKRRVLQGYGDGRPLVIEVEYLEGKKALRIDGRDQGWDPAASSYEAILGTLSDWRSTVPPATLLRGVYPNPRLAWLTYQLSAALWCSSHEQRSLELSYVTDSQQFDGILTSV